jgi:predicted nucleic acid-binding Zn ribbon protein
MKFRFKSKRHGNVVQFDDLMDGLVQEYKLEKLFTIEMIRSIWSEIVGDIMSTHSIPDRVNNGILFITVDHSIYANELIMMQDTILSKLHEQFSMVKLNKIKIAVGKLSWNNGDQ